MTSVHPDGTEERRGKRLKEMAAVERDSSAINASFFAAASQLVEKVDIN